MTATDRRPLGVVSIGVPWFGIETATRHLNETRSALADHYKLVGPETVITDAGGLEAAIDSLRQAGVEALLLQVATFPDGEAPARLAQALNVPIIVHSLPEPDLEHEISLNSLCGANMITYTLTALEAPHAFAHGDPAEEAVQHALLARINGAMALAALRRTRVSLIGFRAPGFYPCAFDELLLRRELGVAIDHVGLNELSRELQDGARREAPREAFPLIEGGELSAEGVARMERFYGALTNVVRDSGHQVVAIKDWPEFFDAEAVGGFWPVLGWIQEDGVVLAPEGDVNGAVTMALQRSLTGTIPTLVDVSAWDDERSTLTLWHYGGAESLARDPDEIRYGAYGREVEYTFAPGRATLARIGLYQGRLRLLTIAVELLDERVTLRRAAGLARTVNTPAGEVVHRMLDEGWEHHPCLVYGDLSDEFAAFAKLTGLPYTAL